ncbi:oxidoreductase [Pandoraea terrae]|uniref:Oxidoreductase n=1 Tax=Pandoraea terrae TaxID=1537710 RepID=A0A5E4T1I9_9BURK|nr:3-oxoacyl-ACP reductase family protein [Pandoraea terrae]VVD79889.1 oxidoreductase [Pandoraea terrae]
MSEKIAVVTGGGMGIGAAICERLAKDGMTVVVADLKYEAAQKTVAKIDADGGRAWPLAMNVGDEHSIADGFAQIAQKHGRCDVLVNNAGIAKTIPFLDCPLDHWHQVMAVNVTGTLLCAQHAARLMREHRWGRVINLASVAGILASAGRTAYGTSKAAVIGLTRQMAIELAPFGITANGIAPGPIETPLTQALHSDVSRAHYNELTPIGRYGQPSEIAGAVSFLASDDSSYITGHVLPVDGGFVCAGLLEI